MTMFPESKLAHKYIDPIVESSPELWGLEIGGSAHNPFGIPRTKNVDYTDAADTVFKRAEIDLCGSSLPVDLVAEGDDLPLPDGSVGWVLSSHVIEHFPDPIRAIREWHRVTIDGGIIFVVVPQPDAAPGDKGLELTTLRHLLVDHASRATYGTHADESGKILAESRAHYHRWNCRSFLEFIDAVFVSDNLRRPKWCHQFEILDWQDPDDKCGNGFSIVLKVIK